MAPTRSIPTTRSRPGAWSRTARSRMSTREALVLAGLVLVSGGCAGTTAPETPNLGRAATPAEVAGWDISIAPDGRGLPSGRGTSVEGTLVYAQKCQACHGEKGVNGPNDRLVGGQGALGGKAPVGTGGGSGAG